MVKLPEVVGVLGNDYPLVRFFARHAVERITGAPLPVDVNAPGPEVVKSARDYLKLHENGDARGATLEPGREQ